MTFVLQGSPGKFCEVGVNSHFFSLFWHKKAYRRFFTISRYSQNKKGFRIRPMSNTTKNFRRIECIVLHISRLKMIVSSYYCIQNDHKINTFLMIKCFTIDIFHVICKIRTFGGYIKKLYWSKFFNHKGSHFEKLSRKNYKRYRLIFKALFLFCNALNRKKTTSLKTMISMVLQGALRPSLGFSVTLVPLGVARINICSGSFKV